MSKDTTNVLTKKTLNVIQDSIFNEIANIKHAFFTRQGGVSTGVYSSLNCCYQGMDDPTNVCTNRQQVMSFLGLPYESLVTFQCIHRDNVIIVNHPWDENNLSQADGIVTNLKNIVLGCDSADCPIVLFADPIAQVIGLAHAGWQSSFRGILENTINKMICLESKAEQISAVIGPCILQSSYEVSPNFYEKFVTHSPLNDSFFIPSKNTGHKFFDLLGFVKAKLKNLNLRQISEIGLDTYTNEDLFFSYRRTTHRKEEDFGGHFSCIYIVS